MSCVPALGRILLLTAIVALIGAIYGYPREAVILALFLVVVFWQYQMHRVQHWLSDPKHKPPDVVGIWGELTARIYQDQRKNKQVQERLQANVEYLQDSFSSMRDGVVMVDEFGAIKWFNKAVEPLLGLRHPEDTGQTLTNLVRAPAFNRYFLEEDYSDPLQYVATLDGQVHLRVEITHFGKGERLLFIRDISAAVRMEQIRRDFVANVSHELRTPLTVLTGYLNTFLDSFHDNAQVLPDQYVKGLKQMKQQAQRMENLLRDLLWLSRIESEKRAEKRELVDVRGLLQELREELASTYPEQPVQLELQTDSKIYGDYRELYSAISNLANNALKYSGAGDSVRISWTQQGEYCSLQVADKGPGIDPMHIPRLTERFYRVDDSRSSNTGGTGLGLAIVKHVAEAHDAQLQIESVLGKGSTFSLIFPVGG